MIGCVLTWYWDVAHGLKFLRFHNISHRDLKPQNLLLQTVNGKVILKIADFGFAKVADTLDMTGTMCGSPLYMVCVAY